MDFEWLEDILVLGEKRIRERRNPFVLFNDNEFMDRFHFHKETAQEIVDLLYPVLEHDTTRNYALSPDLQFLVTLRFLTCATFQGVCADLFNTHRTTISRSIHKVVHEINALRHDYIRFPDDLASVKQQFFSYGNMPGVVGCVDGTHIPIRRPSSNPEAEVFRCRKGFFSINTQVVAGPDYKFYNVVSRWPGSTHDSRIFNNSNLKTCFEDNILSGILLGDSGYPCTRYLFTPVRKPLSPKEIQFNRCQIKTRNIVERSIGIWKKRFACLCMKLPYEPAKVGNMVTTCAILHNIAIDKKETQEYVADPYFVPVAPAGNNIAGNTARNNFINTYF